MTLKPSGDREGAVSAVAVSPVAISSVAVSSLAVSRSGCLDVTSKVQADSRIIVLTLYRGKSP